MESPTTPTSLLNKPDWLPLSQDNTWRKENSELPSEQMGAENLSEQKSNNSPQMDLKNSSNSMQMMEGDWQFLAELFDLSSLVEDQTESSDFGMTLTHEIQPQQDDLTLPQLLIMMANTQTSDSNLIQVLEMPSSSFSSPLPVTTVGKTRFSFRL